MSDLVTEIRARHQYGHISTSFDWRETWGCLCDHLTWPCDAIRAADEIERLQAQVAAADALADAVSAARVENTDWPEFNALLAARNAYRATRSGTETGAG